MKILNQDANTRTAEPKQPIHKYSAGKVLIMFFFWIWLFQFGSNFHSFLFQFECSCGKFLFCKHFLLNYVVSSSSVYRIASHLRNFFQYLFLIRNSKINYVKKLFSIFLILKSKFYEIVLNKEVTASVKMILWYLNFLNLNLLNLPYQFNCTQIYPSQAD